MRRVADGPDRDRRGRRSTGPCSPRSTSSSTTRTVSDATWAALAAELDEQQLMDVVFTVGAYDLVAMAFRSFGVELDDDLLERKPPSP